MNRQSFIMWESKIRQLTPVKIVLLYVVVVGLWIPFSDILLGLLVTNSKVFTYAKVFKDYSYVMTTAWILYTLMNRNMEAIERSKKTLIKINKKLLYEIAERKQVEAVLRKTEEEKEVILDSMSECVVYLDTEKNVLWTNRAASEALKFNLSEPLGLQCNDIWIHDRELCQECPVEKVIKDSRPEQGELTTLDGRTWLLRVYPVINEELKNIVVVALEITEQKRAQEERIRLVTAVEQAAEAIVITDKDGTIRFVNPAFEKITGYSADEVCGRGPEILKSGKHDRNFYVQIRNRLKEGKTWSGRIINKRKDGTLYEEETTISPVQNEQGETINYVAVKRDVTQEVALEAQLRQAQKMEAIGTLAGGIAHDFNNILTPIIINTEMALLDLPPDSELREDLNQVLEAGKHAKELVKQILTFSRQREEELKPLLLSAIVKESLKLIRSTLPSTIEIRSMIEAQSVMILADPTRIHQVLMNLFTNAAYAMSDKGGVIEVSLTLKNLFEHTQIHYPDLQPGIYAALSVSDTGEGIEPAIKEKIFDPFFTTRKTGEGTGLGLSVVHGIVKNHGGALSVDSSPGKGTTVEVLFPYYNQSKNNGQEDSLFLSSGTGHILFVDDEEVILKSAKKMLERLGYSVEISKSSTKALELFSKNPAQYDLVITDYTMPVMTGIDLAYELLRICPDLPVILTTGYNDSITQEKIVQTGMSGLIMKPLITKQVAEMIKKVMKKGMEKKNNG